MLTSFHPGQRWISQSEPELGLGAVVHTTPRTVTITFAASGETREYARDNAPLRRVRFRVGEVIKDSENSSMVVQSFTERNGLIFYRDENRELCEMELSAAISFSKPEERLLAGKTDPTQIFDLRFAALQHQHQRRRSNVRGFVGGRIDLLLHQLYIASETASRLVPRVLLADEVGLGKTIEACLILHRLILTGRVQRALILVPDSLVHQWFVELLRRFNLWFHIFDEERCHAIEAGNPETNPFLDDQLVLSSLSLLTRDKHRLEQAMAAGWDILVVDEAHHLGWSPDAASTEYAVVESLAREIPGLLLLTATPEQLGVASHFARLRLLDPDRFFDLAEFINETSGYREVAVIAEKLLRREKLLSAEVEVLAGILSVSEADVRSKLEKSAPDDMDGWISALLDQHGTGRVMFRNTRATITGFPKRNVQLYSLSPSGDPALFDALADEFAADTDPRVAANFQPDFVTDPRIVWIADLLRRLEGEKLLLICRTQRKVEAIDGALRQKINVKMAMFHEGLSLLQRDRNAAWFAEQDGARILICSEIGSEGRNFQFAHHLILFDLPLDPELVEQRIGRLDRIGQTSEIQIHVPFFPGSPQEVMARWYHDGLNSFAKNLPGGRQLLDQFGTAVHDLARDFHETQQSRRAELEHLIEQTQAARKTLSAQLEEGRDRLLELNSCRFDAASHIVDEIRQQDADKSLDQFLLGIFDHYFIHVEELSPGTYQLGSAGVFADSFPGLPAEGMTVTCDRTKALSREDIQFLTWEHPLVTGAFDMLLGSEKGNSSFAKWPDAKTTGFYLEIIYLLECIAPPSLHIDRFLPPTPVRVVVNHRGEDESGVITLELLQRHLKDGDNHALLERSELRDELLPVLFEEAQSIADRKATDLITHARKTMVAQSNQEITRLEQLRKVNKTVRPEEIELLVNHRAELSNHLAGARLRLDAVRMIQRGFVPTNNAL